MHYKNVCFAEIIRSHRKPAKALIKDIWDLNQDTNDILLSYFLEANPGITREELTAKFQNLDQLNLDFDYSSPKEFPIKSQDMRIISSHIRVSTNHFATGFNDFNDQILMAHKNPSVYTYPNGETIDYYLLTEEVSANMPISTIGLGLTDPSEIFIRSNSLKMICAFYDAIKDEEEFKQYACPNFEDDVLGIVLNHEKIETELEEAEKASGIKNQFQVELLVEKESQKSLIKKGVPSESYELLHKLRRGKTRKTVSDLILQYHAANSWL